MSKTKNFVCRFAVGDPDGRRGSVWRIWAGKKKPDLYIAARSVAGMAKASLHSSGDRHVGLTTQYADELHGGAEKRPPRHFQRWRGGKDIGQGCTLEFQICFPTDQLRHFGNADVAEQNVIWVSAAPAGEMVQISILLGPQTETAGWPGSRQVGARLIGEGRLADLTRVWIVSRPLSGAMFSNADYAQKHLSKIAADLARQRITPGEQHRVVAIFRDDLGIHGFAEFSGDAFVSKTTADKAK